MYTLLYNRERGFIVPLDRVYATDVKPPLVGIVYGTLSKRNDNSESVIFGYAYGKAL
jgi:hypothetical protein